MEREARPWLERVKAWGFLLFAGVCLTNLAIAAVWFVYMDLVTTPARDQLATTHAPILGRWQGGSLTLEFRPDATVDVHDHYTHYGAKIWRFHDRDFALWVFPVFRARFHIDAMPRKDGAGEESIVVDGYHLYRRR